MSKETYSIVDQFSAKARSGLGGGNSGILTMMMLLSAVLSSLFFWQNSTLVFRDVWPPLALFLGLAVGLIPSEGAFFGWKQVRSSKLNMTKAQLSATTAGIVTAVVCSVFSTLALYVVSFSQVPNEIAQYRDWMVFLSLSIPLVCQVAIFAWFSVNERDVVENHERAKLEVIKFNNHIKNEQAKLAAVMIGLKSELEKQLKVYGASVGRDEAGKFLEDGQGPSSAANGSASGPPPLPANAPAGSTWAKIGGVWRLVQPIVPLSGREVEALYGGNGNNPN